MKVLHINTVDTFGGAARAAYRLHRALLNVEIDSQMLVLHKNSDDYTVIKSAQNKLDKIFNIIRLTVDGFLVRKYPDRDKILFSPTYAPWSNVVEMIQQIDPDIVHLHWICGSFFPIEDLLKIKKPIVWSLHDNWAFTGGCHIKWECEKYKIQCEQCPRLASKINKDLSYKTFLRKKKVFSKMPDLMIIGLSHWVADCAKQSYLLKDKDIVVLPNVIDTDLYKPIDKQLARELLGLPLNKKLVMFGAVSATNDINKGFNELLQALNNVQSDIELVVFGSSKPEISPEFKQPISYLGHLYDDYSLKLVYNSADVMIVPSLQENLSNAIMESLACQTPVVAFNVGGNCDLIQHQQNGYLAQPYDVIDLARGIEWVLSFSDNLQQNARLSVLERFDYRVVIPKYIEVYEKVLTKE